MKRFLVLISVFLALCACKTQSTLHYPQSTIIKDSVSVTYKQGQEQPTPIGVRGAATSQFLWNQQRIAGDNNRSCGAATRYDGKPKSLPSGGGAKSAESVESVRDLKIRVDTVFVERWHTQYLPEPAKPIPRFYKDCTIGFWMLLLFLLGSIALTIMKKIYLRR